MLVIIHGFPGPMNSKTLHLQGGNAALYFVLIQANTFVIDQSPFTSIYTDSSEIDTWKPSLQWDQLDQFKTQSKLLVSQGINEKASGLG